MKKKETELRVYTAEFKAVASALAEKREKPVSRVASDLGINENMLRKWMQRAREAGGGGSASPAAGLRKGTSAGTASRG